MRNRSSFALAVVVLTLASCSNSEPGPAPFEEADPAGYAACETYMTAPPAEVLEQFDDELDLVLYAGASAYEHAVDSSTAEIADSVNEELTAAGVPSVVAAKLIPACEGKGFEIGPGSAAEAAQNV